MMKDRAIGILVALLSFCLSLGVARSDDAFNVLIIGDRVISADGNIDPTLWLPWDFPYVENITKQVKGDHPYLYHHVGKRDYLIFGSDPNNERYWADQARRLQRVSARKDLVYSKGKIIYQGKALLYHGDVISGPDMWGMGWGDEGPGGIRFGRYLIFMVHARPSSQNLDFDFVLYDLSTDQYRVRKVDDTWELTELLGPDDAE